MPEGDTVARTADRLHRALSGVPLDRVDLRWGTLDGSPLVGARTLEVVSRGKHLLHRVEGGWTIHSHLKMEGQWRVERASSPSGRRYERHPHVRALLDARGWRCVGLRLGQLDLVRTDEGELVEHLGPDILGPTVDLGAVAAAVTTDLRGLAETLLDQRVVAGIGTFWASELLFIKALPPWSPSAEVPVDSVRTLLERGARLMARAAQTGWQSSTGETRRDRTQYVHARSGRPCLRCGDTVRVALSGPPGRERTIFYCPRCQGGLAPTDDGRPQRPLGASGGHR